MHTDNEGVTELRGILQSTLQPSSPPKESTATIAARTECELSEVPTAEQN